MSVTERDMGEAEGIGDRPLTDIANDVKYRPNHIRRGKGRQAKECTTH